MTDFIHEHPKDETPAPPPPAPAEETPMDEKAGQKRVYGYIFILFVVALSLLLWAFLMNQRSTDEMLSELRGSTGALQTTLDRNVALEQQNEALETEMEALKAQLAEQQEENAALRQQAHAQEDAAAQTERRLQDTDAARTVYEAAALAADGDYAGAAACLASWETAELHERLTEEDANRSHLNRSDGAGLAMVRPRYDALVEQLTGLGFLAAGEDGQLTATNPAG